ncbi:hypothetical protein ACFX2I_008007 [Malus domestica]
MRNAPKRAARALSKKIGEKAVETIPVAAADGNAKRTTKVKYDEAIKATQIMIGSIRINLVIPEYPQVKSSQDLRLMRHRGYRPSPRASQSRK